MVRSLTFLPAMMFAAAIVAAQAPTQTPPATNPPATAQPPSSPQQPSEPAGRMASANTVTYSGCVKPGATADSWILDNAEAAKAGMAGQASASAPGQAGGAVGTSGAAKTTLNLTAKPSVDLKTHANHKVEVTGTLAPAAGAAASAPASGAASARQAFTVDSLKMVSATCP